MPPPRTTPERSYAERRELKMTRLIGGPKDGQHYGIPPGQAVVRFAELDPPAWAEMDAGGPPPFAPCTEHTYTRRRLKFSAGERVISIDVMAEMRLSDEDVAGRLLTEGLEAVAAR